MAPLWAPLPYYIISIFFVSAMVGRYYIKLSYFVISQNRCRNMATSELFLFKTTHFYLQSVNFVLNTLLIDVDRIQYSLRGYCQPSFSL